MKVRHLSLHSSNNRPELVERFGWPHGWRQPQLDIDVADSGLIGCFEGEPTLNGSDIDCGSILPIPLSKT